MSTTIYPPGPLTFVSALLPVSMDESANGEAVDCNGYGPWRCCLLAVGAMDVGTLAVKVQHSDDASLWTDISGGGFTSIITTGFDLQAIQFYSAKRWIRLAWANGAAFALMSAVFGLPTRPTLFGGAL